MQTPRQRHGRAEEPTNKPIDPHILQERIATTPTLLLDDPAAELDGSKLAAFIGQVERLRCQLVLTSLSRDQDPFGQPDAAFFVDQGRVSPV